MAHPQRRALYDQRKHQVQSDFLPNNVNLEATISWGGPYSLRNVNDVHRSDARRGTDRNRALCVEYQIQTQRHVGHREK